MKFKKLTAGLAKIEASTDRHVKKETFLQILEEWRMSFGSSHVASVLDFPLLRLILPRLDRERVYGLKESSLALLFIKVLGLSSSSALAGPLLVWADSKSHFEKNDFATVLVSYIERVSTTAESSDSLDVDSINSVLDQLADIERGVSSSSKLDARVTVFEKLLSSLAPADYKWLIRILLKDLKLHAFDYALLHGVHEYAVALYETRLDLRAVCAEVADMSSIGDAKELKLFYSFMPMKLTKCLPDQVPKYMDGDAFWMEEKLDGHRMCIHKHGSLFRYFGREGVDHTNTYGADFSLKFSQRLFPLLCRDERVVDMILDGEMMVFDPVSKKFRPFGSLNTVANSSSLLHPDMVRVCFVVFDLLLVNDYQIVTKVPLKARQEWLRMVVTEEEGTLMINPHVEGTSALDVVQYLENVLQNNGEGVVIKNPHSLYIPGMRGKSWLKLKPDFISELGEHLDLVIVGLCKGKGARSGVFSSFHCAARSDVDNAMVEPSDFAATKWKVVTKCGIGFSQEFLSDFYDSFVQHAVVASSMNRPDWLAGSSLPELPDYWIDPWNSVMLQVKAAEIVPTDSFFTMRFPRFVRVRTDKVWWDASTCENVINLYSTSRDIRPYLIGKASANTAKLSPPKSTEFQLPSHRKMAEDIMDVQQLSSVFSEEEFSVISGLKQDPEMTKQAIEKMIASNGGKLSALPTDRTKYVIVGDKNVHSSGYIRKKDSKWNVLSVYWVVDSVRRGKCAPFQPRYLLNATAETLAFIAKSMDTYGDWYTELVNAEELSNIIEFMEVPMEERMSIEECRRFSIDYGLRPCGAGDFMFGTNICFLDLGLEYLQELCKFYGAVLTGEISETTTYIVSSSGDDVDDVRAISREYLERCLCAKSLLPI